MNIDRNIKQGDKEVALSRLKFCLDRLEDSKRQFEGVAVMRPVVQISMEEIIGAMISAEQILLGDYQ